MKLISWSMLLRQFSVQVQDKEITNMVRILGPKYPLEFIGIRLSQPHRSGLSFFTASVNNSSIPPTSVGPSIPAGGRAQEGSGDT
jgi:hypothetical protein